jgi:hypothetical protein
MTTSPIRVAAPVPESPESSLGLLQLSPGRSWTGVLAGAAIGLLALTLAALALLYSPGLPNYTLTPESLTIGDCFYPVTLNATDVDAERVRVVDIAADPDWRPATRTNAFGNLRYHSGWFQVANGKKARMYWAEGKRLVLLPPKGNDAPVLLEVREPERLAEDIRRLWLGGL